MVYCHVAVAIVAAVAAVVAAAAAVAELGPTDEDGRYQGRLNRATSRGENRSVFLCKEEQDILGQTSRRKDRDSRSILSPQEDCIVLVILGRLRCSRLNLETNGSTVRFLSVRKFHLQNCMENNHCMDHRVDFLSFFC